MKKIRDGLHRANVSVGNASIQEPTHTKSVCANRRSQSEFLCVECGFQANADWIGASNIRRKGLEARAAVITPMVSVNAFA
jgi:putative transposase